MPINAHPDYLAAEKEYFSAKNLGEKIPKLEKMISLAPKHKGGENLRAQLKSRLKKFQRQIEKEKKSGKSGKKGIKKEDMQAVILGFTNSGKSSLLKILTNAEPEISSYNFTTKYPLLGILKYGGVNIQLIEIPAINSEFYDKGLVHTADTLLIIVTEICQIPEIEKEIANFKGEKIIVFNNKNQHDKRKLSATLKSKRYNFIFFDLKDKESIGELKEKIFQSFNRIRIYTKEPGKSLKEKSDKPIVLKKGSKVKDVAEKIFHGFSNKVKESFITGPSSKFPNQKVGLTHLLKDRDIIEFKTK